MRTSLGISLKEEPKLREIVKRLAFCNAVTAAEQSEFAFLGSFEALLDARLVLDDDQALIAEQSIPVHTKQPQLFSAPRRGAPDALLLRAADEREVVRDEASRAARNSVEVLRRTGAVMSNRAANELPGALADIERELLASTKPASRFIAAKQEGFELSIDSEAPTQFPRVDARTRVGAGCTALLSVAPLKSGALHEFKATVLERKPGDGPAALPADAFELEKAAAFRLVNLDEVQAMLLQAAMQLGLVVELEAQPVISTSTLKTRAADVVRVSNWDALLAAVLGALAEWASARKESRAA